MRARTIQMTKAGPTATPGRTNNHARESSSRRPRPALTVEDDAVALLDVARQHALRHAVLQQAHDRAAQRPRAVRGVVPLVDQAVLEALGHVDLDALLLGTLEDVAQHDVGNLLDLRLGELSEDDDLVQAVQELGPARKGERGVGRGVQCVCVTGRVLSALGNRCAALFPAFPRILHIPNHPSLLVLA